MGVSRAEEPVPISFYKKYNFLVDVGYSRLSTDLNLPRDLRIHRNHADDVEILSGYAGDTDLDRLQMDMMEIAAGIAVRPEFLNIALISQLVAKWPVRLDARLERQQENDPRPPSNASYIYTKAEDARMLLALRLGLGGAVLLSDHDWWLEIRGLVDVGKTRLNFEKGWTRNGADEFETRSEADGWFFSPNISVGVGTRKWLLKLGGGYAQIAFNHSDTRMVNHTGKGFELHFGFTHKR